MGLTGVIINASFKLKPIKTAYIKQKAIKAKNIDEIFNLFLENMEYTYSVAWLDCLAKGKKIGRSILMLGEHATIDELPNKYTKGNPLILKEKKSKTIPFMFPNFILNTLSVKIFNFLYYNKQLKKTINNVINYETFFYPLDAIYHWNRIYGEKGFTQYQFVLPAENSKDGLKIILDKISKSGQGSFLSVLKYFGKSSKADNISFPMKGYTLALDFKINKKLFPLLDELDKTIEELGGRIYLSKDVRMSSEMFKKTYLNNTKFKAIVTKYNPKNNFNSIQSERLKVLK